MTFELTTTTNPKITVPALKNPALAESANYMARIINGTYENMRRSSEALAIALYKVEDGKLYADDGYKSTADFAEKILGLKKSSVSTLISTAKRFSKDGEMNAPAGLEGQTAYNLYYLKDATDEQIATAVESGELSPTSSQKDIKAWADAHINKDAPANAPAKPINMYRVAFRNGSTIIPADGDCTEEEIESKVKSVFPGNAYESKELPAIKCDDGTSIKRRVYVIDDGRDCPYAVIACYKLVKVPKVTPKAKTISFTDMSDDELLAELERRRVAKSVPADTTAKAVAKVKSAGNSAK